MIDLARPDLSANDVVAGLGLLPHPEGGFYRETFRDGDLDQRGVVTAIHFLLPRGVISHWHRVDAVEIWFWHAGAPLRLDIASADAEPAKVTLGRDLGSGQSFQGFVPPHAWQRAESLGDWTLVSCTVSPAFLFSGFELAPPGWEPAPAA
ncbi:cupin domain-containing protein [Acidisoma cellulosilyticum]|uniref:cupin domain-containing protein n=1 Tax=Acidisoma cellulosilyticum TaxID=2802395 RepID=UPI0029CAB9A6|nr:cupin domain-containing protein [Acidisoma cellulosilyticum]